MVYMGMVVWFIWGWLYSLYVEGCMVYKGMVVWFILGWLYNLYEEGCMVYMRMVVWSTVYEEGCMVVCAGTTIPLPHCTSGYG